MEGKIKIKHSKYKFNYIISGAVILTIGIIIDNLQVIGEVGFVGSFFDILCPSMGFAIGIIALIRDDEVTNIFYRSIGVGFIFLGIINICNMLPQCGINVEFKNALVATEMLAAYLIVIVSYIVMKFKYKLLGTIILYGISMSLILIGNIYRYSKESNLGLDLQNIVIILICSSVAFYMNYNRNRSEDESEDKYVYAYLGCILSSQIISFVGTIYGLTVELELYFDSIKYFSYFIIFEGCVEHLIKIAYFNVRENLEKTKENKEIVYKELSLRNRVLSDLNNSLIKSEKSNNRMLSKFNDGVILFYMEKVSYANDAAIKMLNLGKKEYLLGLDFGQIIYLIAQNITEKHSGAYSDIMTRDYFLRNDKNIYIFKEIKHRDREYEVTILRADLLNQIIYIKDITDISQGIKHKKMYEDLIKEREIKEEFYSNISHELRTPVNVIYSALQLKDIYIREEIFELIEKNDNVIKQNCLRLIRTVNNFIDTNKISEGKMRADIGVYNIVEVVENIAQVSTKYLDKVNTKLIFDAEEEEIYSKIDKGMIERVVLNLLSNSIKYGEANGEIYIYIDISGEMAQISLRNNGYSIPEEAYPYIFEKFTKTDTSLSRDAEGSGLGLYLVRELVYLNNGSLELSENNGDGNEFIIRLPIFKDDINDIENIVSEMNTLEEKVDIEFSDVYI